MEFKQPSRQRRETRPDVSRPVRPVAPRAVPQPAPVVAPPSAEPTKPKSSLAHLRRFRPNKKTTLIAGSSVLAISLAVGMAAYKQSSSHGAESKRPTYQTVLPAGKSISQMGGWKRVSPADKDPVFAYADTLDGVAISVSQQPMPQSFKDNVDSQVAELAQKFNATNKLDAGNTKLYIGTSAKGPQSVIFAKGDTLVLIKSLKKISDASWIKYAGSLN